MLNSDVYSPNFVYHMTKTFPDTKSWFKQPLRDDGIDVEGFAKALGLDVVVSDDANEYHTDELLNGHTINVPSDADIEHRRYLIAKAIGLLISVDN